MNKPVLLEKTALQAILEWSNGRPAWQRDALRRILVKGKLDDADHDELVELTKLGRGAKVEGLQAVHLEKEHLPANPSDAEAVSLTSISDVVGVNNLAPNQTLSFAPDGITIVYGDNGTGKSGYSRILKRACRARHAGKIEANVYDAQAPKVASAQMTFALRGIAQAPLAWQDGRPHAVLSAISVFDSECAAVHLRDKNEIAFRPFGLDIPDELAAACIAVKEKLTAQQRLLERSRDPIFLKPTWKAGTYVGKALAGLSANTLIPFIAKLATLSPEQKARLESLRTDLAKDPLKAEAEQLLKANNVKRLITAVNAFEAASTDQTFGTISKSTKEAIARSEAATLAAQKAFDGEAVPGIGGEVWRALWESARRYAQSTAFPAKPFPPGADEATCVLCLQELSAEALGRMARFEEFITRDLALEAQRAQQAADESRQKITGVPIRTRVIKPMLDEVGLHGEELRRQTRRFIATTRLRRRVFLRALDVSNDEPLPPPAPSPSPALTKLELGFRKYAEELRKSAGAEERKALETEYFELIDRELLGAMLPNVTAEVQRLKDIQFLTVCINDTSTNAVTKFGNDLADQIVTPKMRDRFQEEIFRLAAAKVRVEIVRSGGKYGSPQYQVRLFAKPDAKVHDVLSEGEQTCVALAAFMTELATAAHQSALVFDDPVSSLDHRWRGKVAERLIDETAQRQVVVFTHDLVFVNDLLDRAKSKGLEPHLVTLNRGPTGAGHVADGLPWKAQSVEDRLDRLDKHARAAKVLYEKDDETGYETKIFPIYNQLRATWERGLEDIAFFRVIQRHRDYVETKHLKKASVLTDVDCDAFSVGFKRCCDVVDAHDPSTGRNAAPPPPDEVLKDIQSLRDWASSLRDRQKKVAT
jgi:hypothetical protein